MFTILAFFFAIIIIFGIFSEWNSNRYHQGGYYDRDYRRNNRQYQVPQYGNYPYQPDPTTPYHGYDEDDGDDWFDERGNRNYGYGLVLTLVLMGIVAFFIFAK